MILLANKPWRLDYVFAMHEQKTLVLERTKALQTDQKGKGSWVVEVRFLLLFTENGGWNFSFILTQWRFYTWAFQITSVKANCGEGGQFLSLPACLWAHLKDKQSTRRTCLIINIASKQKIWNMSAQNIQIMNIYLDFIKSFTHLVNNE